MPSSRAMRAASSASIERGALSGSECTCRSTMPFSCAKHDEVNRASSRAARMDCILSGGAALAEAGQEGGQQADSRQESADLVNEVDARVIGDLAEDGGGDAGHPEGESEEDTRDHSDFAGEQLLRVNEN